MKKISDKQNYTLFTIIFFMVVATEWRPCLKPYVESYWRIQTLGQIY